MDLTVTAGYDVDVMMLCVALMWSDAVMCRVRKCDYIMESGGPRSLLLLIVDKVSWFICTPKPSHPFISSPLLPSPLLSSLLLSSSFSLRPSFPCPLLFWDYTQCNVSQLCVMLHHVMLHRHVRLDITR